MDKSTGIPLYLLERGDSAREYRRRSSCASRIGNLPLASRSRASSIGSNNPPQDLTSMLLAPGGPSQQDAEEGTTLFDLENYGINPTPQVAQVAVEDRAERTRTTSITFGQRFGIAKPKIIHL
ncbi:hypothetical protein GGI12_000204 [Dipsacomyces acuminosporus]|nr:hypothetical protein GGI12_000204 [Dipsacomyces acuminosporus]